MMKRPEALDIRAAPGRKPVRFRKGIVIGLLALGSGALLTVILLALKGPLLRSAGQGQELYNTDHKPTADGLAALPGDYGHIKLGPPLPGDLGRPILAQQRAQAGRSVGGEVSAAEQRLAQQAIQAKESAIFFRIENRPQQAGTTVESHLPDREPNRIPNRAGGVFQGRVTAAASIIRTPWRHRSHPIR